jgi:hypothetical protein
MVLSRLDRIEEARADFERLQSIMGDVEREWMEHEESIALFEECKQLLGGSDVQPESPTHVEGEK